MPDKFDEICKELNVTDISETQDSRIVRIVNESGEGTMTAYKVFEGAYIMYNNFHMQECESAFKPNNHLLCIDHCREGIIETGVAEDAYCYISAGDLRVDNGIHNDGNSFFPLKHYYGITVGFDIETAQKAMDDMIKDFSVNISDIAKKYCSNAAPYVINSAPEITNFFPNFTMFR